MRQNIWAIFQANLNTLAPGDNLQIEYFVDICPHTTVVVATATRKTTQEYTKTVAFAGVAVSVPDARATGWRGRQRLNVIKIYKIFINNF